VAAYTKTIANGLRVFGPEPTEKWAATGTSGTTPMVWGSDKWGYGTVGLPIYFAKGIADSLTLDSTIQRIFYRFIIDSVSIDSAIGKAFSKGVPNSFPVTGTVGKGISKGIFESVANTTAIGKEIGKYYDNSLPISTTIDRGATYYLSITDSFGMTTGQSIYKMVQSYTVTYGGISNIVDWSRPTSFTKGSSPTTSWATATKPSTTWS